eukprot:COSAG05_NODE_156_length_15696_cov_359.955440_18_plen_102_part_00
MLRSAACLACHRDPPPGCTAAALCRTGPALSSPAYGRLAIAHASERAPAPGAARAAAALLLHHSRILLLHCRYQTVSRPLIFGLLLKSEIIFQCHAIDSTF